ncbi:tRNA lysidine(34) synthetase TilS [Corynebacterium sp. TAE3-ERU12]|uniref:tRNA lysidine(34) synthetase TilS n=1 Tax=Corynebacterium sp. TAE3-ERU12 TaxID=2849491 RepID=UPI001C46AA2E|nr:tRNA lysidine(34) synthetase TilS [Corynebacterium sp. TAE3-ERU12]MBV7295935.1 tRNA lysidine(34) synthetase TilS [Corynebacterium sp. TAE3-ERU12]
MTTPFWPRRSPAFLRLRHHVRAGLGQWLAGSGELTVGVSGGADSLALAAACIAEGRSLDRIVHAVVVDHGLQAGSGEVAACAAETVAAWGAEAEVQQVRVAKGGGVEDAARRARFDALFAAAHRNADGGPAWLGLAHTADDQAETMLLGVARGGGTTAIAGMAAQRRWANGVIVARPLLAARRDDTVAACAELGVHPWQDPHNADRRFSRVRVRRDVLPSLVEAVGPAVIDNLARTARHIRRDAEYLDQLAGHTLGEVASGDCANELPAAEIAALPEALGTRVLKLWVEGLGASGVTEDHISALVHLVASPGGRMRVQLPGMVVVSHQGGILKAYPGAAPAHPDGDSPGKVDPCTT